MNMIVVIYRNLAKTPAVYCKHMNTLCRRYIESVDVKPCGT